MKRLISITVVLAMLFTVLSLGALTVSAEPVINIWGDLTWTLDSEGTLTISGAGEMDDALYDDTDAWRSYRDSIKTVVIESGVTTIGDYAFCHCRDLESVTIPDGVTAIGNSAFYGCTALESATIPDSVTAIGDEAFYVCTALVNIKVNSGNTEYCDIDGVLFNKSKTTLIQYPAGKKGTSYTIPDSVTAIGDDAFDRCKGLESVTIPDSVTAIGDSAFARCEALDNVTIPDGVTAVGNSAFYGCTALKSVTIPDGVTTIGDAAFAGCEALDSITIPDSVTVIGDSAFSGCTALESVTIPEGVTDIGYFAFEFCAALESVTIPDSVTAIGDLAFNCCSNLTSIDVADGNIEYLDIDGVLFNKDKTTLIQYPVGRTNASYTIPDSVTRIGNGSFEAHAALTRITIGASVTVIGYYAFNSCDALETVYYGGGEGRWDHILINEGNDSLLNAKVVFGVIGDVNGDGCANNLDATGVLKYDAGLISEISEAADVNGDGCTNNLDAAKILKYDAGIIDEL